MTGGERKKENKKKTSLWKVSTQKDVKLENPPKPEPGCQSEDGRWIPFNGKP